VGFDSAAVQNIGDIMIPEELRSLIESDPEASAHYAAGRHAACAERCRVIAPAIRQPVDGGQIQKIASMNGVWAKITLARESAETPAQIKGICITFLDWVRKDWRIDFDFPEVQQMLGGLIQSGLVTEQEVSVLDSAANTPQTFTTDDIQRAMGA
jgi:hypothetical protein